jgi:hypothetical protein
MKELERVVAALLNEAKGKKKKKKDAEKDPEYIAMPKEYGYADSFDFSKPLDIGNLYKNQGASNWGPYTADGSKGEGSDKALRAAVREHVVSQIHKSNSPWTVLGEALRLSESKNRVKDAWAVAESMLPTGKKGK